MLLFEQNKIYITYRKKGYVCKVRVFDAIVMFSSLWIKNNNVYNRYCKFDNDTMIL